MFEFAVFSLASGDDPGGPFGDVAARRSRSGEMVDGGGLNRAPAKRDGQSVEGFFPFLMGEVGALFISGFW